MRDTNLIAIIQIPAMFVKNVLWVNFVPTSSPVHHVRIIKNIKTRPVKPVVRHALPDFSTMLAIVHARDVPQVNISTRTRQIKTTRVNLVGPANSMPKLIKMVRPLVIHVQKDIIKTMMARNRALNVVLTLIMTRKGRAAGCANCVPTTHNQRNWPLRLFPLVNVLKIDIWMKTLANSVRAIHNQRQWALRLFPLVNVLKIDIWMKTLANSVLLIQIQRQWALRLFPLVNVQPAITVPMVIAHSVPSTHNQRQ